MIENPLGRSFLTHPQQLIPLQRSANFIFGLILALALAGSGFFVQDAHAKGKKPPEQRGQTDSVETQTGTGEDGVIEEETEIPARSKDAPAEIDTSNIRREAPGERSNRAAEQAERAPSGTQAAPAATTDSAPSAIPEPAAAPSEKLYHTVWLWQESRDCLWKLAKKYYKDPWKWKMIYLANRSTILDPAVIYPKQRIEIPRQGN